MIINNGFLSRTHAQECEALSVNSVLPKGRMSIPFMNKKPVFPRENGAKSGEVPIDI